MYKDTREKVVKMAKKAVLRGLVEAAEGNFSVRIPDKPMFAITPSAVEYDKMTDEDIVILELNGKKVYGERKPTSEWRLHATIYKNRDDVNGIVHVHPIYSSVLAVMGEDVPFIIEEQLAYIRGEIKVAEYGVTGTEDLAKKALEALEDRRAVILKNHGLVAVGETPEMALYVALVAEKLAKIYYLARVGGKVDLIPDWAISKLIEKHYGDYM